MEFLREFEDEGKMEQLGKEATKCLSLFSIDEWMD